MHAVNTHQSAGLQRILQVTAALVALVVVAMSAAVLVRHLASTGGTVVPATQAAPAAHGSAATAQRI